MPPWRNSASGARRTATPAARGATEMTTPVTSLARLAVLGSPIAHSRSPRIHEAAYRVLGLDWTYRAIECGEPELEAFLAERGPEWLGFSVTMPLKVEARRIAFEVDDVARESGVVNTLVRRELGWYGANTDVAGLAAAITGADLDVRSTVVLGSGATAVSAILALRRLGAERVMVRARNRPAVADLVSRFSRDAPGAGGAAFIVEPHEDALQDSPTMVVSALPGQAAASIDIPESLLAVPLFDVAYDPWPSPLAARWRAAGGAAVAGTEMLVEQALVQVRLFLNGDPDRPLDHEAEVLRAMRAAV